MAGAPAPGDELCGLSATALAARLQRQELSARDVMAAHLARIDRINPIVNAIVTLVPERALAGAAAADERMARGEPLGLLHGLPIVHKDLLDTAGIRTTRGSPFYRDHVPDHDAPVIRRVRDAGAITCGKSNTPEFGAGSQTFNAIFGATRNPYDLTRTCGGSSGGSAVALACGMVPIADGTDVGGSLRNPAAFCNVVGFRPSPGRVPNPEAGWSPLPVVGPMARYVEDVALLFSVMAGPVSGSPLSILEEGDRVPRPLDGDVAGLRIAWWHGLGGLPIDPEIRHVVDAARPIFTSLGCTADEAEPDFTGVDEAFRTLRFAANHAFYAPLVRERPEWVKDTIREEVARAERLSGADVSRALARQVEMFRQTQQFFRLYDCFVLPVTQVAPFAVDTPYPSTVAGEPMTDYLDWMRTCWYVSFMAAPAISVPAGFTADGLPVGLQIVGPPGHDWRVLQVAYAFEQATRHGWRQPFVLRA